MRIRERYELAEELSSRYRGSGRVERGQLHLMAAHRGVRAETHPTEVAR